MRCYRVWSYRRDRYLTVQTNKGPITHWNKASQAERAGNKELGSGYVVRCFKMVKVYMEGECQ